MPTNHTGDPTAITPRQAVVVQNPVDGDPRNVASNNAAIIVLADILKYAMDKMGIIDQVSAWTAIQNFSAGLTTAAPSVMNDSLSVLDTVSCQELVVAADSFLNGSATVGAAVTAATVAAPTVTSPLLVATGVVSMTGGVVAPTTAHTNKLTPSNMIKAWGRVTTGPSPAIVAGFNLHATTPLTYSGGVLMVKMATAMAATSGYVVMGMTPYSAGPAVVNSYTTGAPDTFQLRVYNALTALDVDLSTEVRVLDFIVVGEQ